MANHDNDHDHDHDEQSYGLALGFRILEAEGKLYLAEAEIAPYVDAPEELGVTLVFHPLDGIDPLQVGDETDWPAWPLDIDDDLSRDPSASMPNQFAAVTRQLRELSDDRLREYLRIAWEDAGE